MRSYKLMAVILATLMLASALPLMASTAAAEGGETIPLYVWDGEGSTELASEAANWYQDIGGVIVNDVLPTNNSHVLYDATSVKSCTWDLAYPQFVAYSLTLATGYTGTLTQGDVDMGIGEGGFLIQKGTVNGNNARNVYCAGNLASTGGAVTQSTVNLHMTGEGAHITSWTIRQYLRSLVVYFNVTIDAGCTVVMRGLVVLPNATLDIQATSIAQINPASYNIDAIQNQGAVIGHGTMDFLLGSASYSIAPGRVDCPVTISLYNGAADNRIATLSGQALLGSSLEVVSNHANHKVTLDLNGYSLSADGITVGTRGAIVGDGTIINGGDFDASAGVFGVTGQYVQADDGTITLGAGQSFTDLTVNEGVTATLGSDVTVSGATRIYGTLVTNGYTLTRAEGDQWAPIITTTPGDDARVLREYSYTPAANETVTYEVTQKPDWLTWDGTTLSGTPTEADVGTSTVILRATSYVGWGSVEQTWDIDVSLIDFEFTTPPARNGYVDSEYRYIPATTMDEHGVTYAVTTDSPYLTWNATSGLLHGRLIYRDPIHVTVAATDVHGRTIWENYTIEVGLPVGEVEMRSIVSVVVALAFLVILTAISLWRVDQLTVMAGFAWIACSLFIFYEVDLIFLFLGTGIGLWMLLTGVMDYYG
jgi:hypothetical protein